MSYIGKTIGHIHITDFLGEGGMGTVYVGFDERLRRKVAVKALRSDCLASTTRARLLREARLLSQLDHPGICRIHEYIEGDDSDFLVLELVHGKDLRQAMDSGLDPELGSRIAEQLAETLATAHAKGIVHRDLKAANVMLVHPDRIKVLDFGIACSVGDGPATDLRGHESATAAPGLAAYVQTEHGSLLGTAMSMSPEQARGEPTTAASDMYSFGLLLQELATGRPPYEPDLPRHVLLQNAAAGDTLPVTGVDGDLATLINRLKSLAPEARPSAVEAAERLRWIRGKPRRRRRWLVAAAVVLLMIGVLEYILDLRRERDLALEALTVVEQVRALSPSSSIARRPLGPAVRVDR